MSKRKTRETIYEVAVIGGGAAGLSAALNLARARRTAIVIDAGHPRNAPAKAAHGLLGNESIFPLELLSRGRAEALTYGADILKARVTEAKPADEYYALTLDDDRIITAQQLVIATGVYDELPDIAGLEARWGRDVVHCPYCHGWEIRDRHIGVIATSRESVYQAMLFQQWSSHVTLFTHTIEFADSEIAALDEKGIAVVNSAVVALEITRDSLTGVELADGRTVAVEAAGIGSTTHANLEGLEALGLETHTEPHGTRLYADELGHTNIPGIWGTGNVVNPNLQLSESAAHGARLAMTLNNEQIFAAANIALAAAQEHTTK